MPSATSYGYDIQSRVLWIPDRYGFFSQGPPRVQELEEILFGVLIMMRIATILEEAWTIYTVEYPQGKPLLPLLALNGLGHIMSIICTWAPQSVSAHTVEGKNEPELLAKFFQYLYPIHLGSKATARGPESSQGT